MTLAELGVGAAARSVGATLDRWPLVGGTGLEAKHDEQTGWQRAGNMTVEIRHSDKGPSGVDRPKVGAFFTMHHALVSGFC